MRRFHRSFVLAFLLSGTGVVAGCGGGGGGGADAVPTTPADVVLVPGARTMGITWRAVPGATSYSVYVSTSPSVDDLNYGILPDGMHIPAYLNTSVTVGGLGDGETYYARVSATNAAGVSALSAPVQTTLVPGAPTNAGAFAGVGSLTASWSASKGATAFDVYLGRDPSISSANWAAIPGGQRLLDAQSGAAIAGLSNGTPYWFVVVARNAAGRSPDSGAASASPSARGTFAEGGTIDAGSSVPASASADLTGDGVADLAVLDGPSGTVSVFPGHGDGTFGTSIELSTGEAPSSLVAADLNDDGAVDIVTTDSADGTVSVMLHDPEGGFLPRVSYPAGLEPHALAVASMNPDLDAYPDLVITDTALNQVIVLFGVGDGTFAFPVTVPVGLRPESVAVGDLNGDGATDLVTANHDSGDVSVCFGDGFGDFGPRVDFAVGLEPARVEARDFDGDGDLDLVVTTSGDGRVVLLRGAGDGSFVADVPTAVGTTPEGFVSGDFNGDGALDLAIADPTDATVRIMLGDGLGGFHSFFVLDLPLGPLSLCVADFDGDGILDLAATNTADGSVTLLIGSGV